jgi:hypothetical protein
MPDASTQIETNNPASYERRAGPYARAILNPDVASFTDLLAKGRHSILEVGCGNPPRLSWRLISGDIWVGCDPSIDSPGSSILVQKGDRPLKEDTNLVVFSEKVEEVPPFSPDAIVTIAPNPQDIVEGSIFNDELKKFIDINKKQYFVVAIDTRTVEALEYGEEATDDMLKWMKENGFVKSMENPIMDRVVLNSGDIESGAIPVCFVSRGTEHGRTR